LFQQNAFFDPQDLLQVKYEMLRQVRTEYQTVRQAAWAFGFSRPSFYQAQAAFEQGGLPGLLPRKRGPRHAHKLTAEVVKFLVRARAVAPALSAPELAQQVEEHFGVKVHSRTVERRLQRPEKNDDDTWDASPPLDTGTSEGLVEGYEELRQRALHTGAKHQGGLGLALLMRQGMKSWMDAWSPRALEVPIRPHPQSGREQIVPLDLQAEVLMILTGMALSTRREVSRYFQ
jgi:transposase